MLRLLRLREYAHIVQGHIERNVPDHYFNRATLRVVIFFLFYMLCNHWMACGWLFLARAEGPEKVPTWALQDGLFDEGTTDYHWYARAFYFVLTVIRYEFIMWLTM